MKFNVGDIIKGREGSGCAYLITNERMTKAEVVNVYEGVYDDIKIKVLECDDNFFIGMEFHVCSKYFDLVKQKKEKSRKPIVIYNRGKEVIAVDKNTGKKAIARCCPEDTFDFETGAKIAFERLLSDPDNIAIGDTVRVVDTGALYTTNVDKVIEMTNEKSVVAKYTYDNDKGYGEGVRKLDDVYKVLNIDGEHVLIQKTYEYTTKYGGEVLLIGKRGLEKC